jgi:TolB-like protein
MFGQAKKVAILDFENTSGIVKYDGLGKSLSNMIITDLHLNISSKKIILFERNQLNKILDEQDLQKSKDFDNKTAVNFGKLSGVDYVFLGSIFVLNETCNITSRLVNVETSEIVLSTDVNGNIEEWLRLKTSLSESIAKELNNPIELDESVIDNKTLLLYSEILESIDNLDYDKAFSDFQELSFSEVDDSYLMDIEKKLNIIKNQSLFSQSLNKINSKQIDCTFLGEISNISMECSSHIWWRTFYQKTYQGSPIETLEKINENRKELDLEEYVSIKQYQDELYEKTFLFKDLVDALIKSNLELDCERNLNEFAISMLISVFNKSLSYTSTEDHPKRHLELYNLSKSYYLKLIKLNPNSFELNMPDKNIKYIKSNYQNLLDGMEEIQKEDGSVEWFTPE